VPALIDLTGQKFGRLTAIRREPNGRTNPWRWRCVLWCRKADPAVAGHPRQNLVVRLFARALQHRRSGLPSFNRGRARPRRPRPMGVALCMRPHDACRRQCRSARLDPILRLRTSRSDKAAMVAFARGAEGGRDRFKMNADCNQVSSFGPTHRYETRPEIPTCLVHPFQVGTTSPPYRAAAAVRFMPLPLLDYCSRSKRARHILLLIVFPSLNVLEPGGLCEGSSDGHAPILLPRR
jgi:hypothetical protein